MKRKIWIMYDRTEFRLPLVIADSASELSMLTGERLTNIRSTASKLAAGKQKTGRFACVEVEDDR